jgi:uncharacterized protein (DUF2126 family)
VLVVGRGHAALASALASLGFDVEQAPEAARPFDAVVVGYDGAALHPAWRSLRPKLGRRGRLFVVAGASRAIAMLPELSAVGLEPKRLMLVHDPATVAVVVAACGKQGGLVVTRAGGG